MSFVYSVSFSGETIEATVTNEASEVENWVTRVRSMQQEGPLIVGLDCEWKPNHVRGMSSKVALLQLCVGNMCLIVQIFYLDHIPQALRNFLDDASVTFVGAGIEGDVSKLLNDYGLTVRNTSDIGELGRRQMVWPHLPGLKECAREIMGISMEKPRRVTMSNWQKQPLSIQQIEYACIDAYVSYRIGLKLLSQT